MNQSAHAKFSTSKKRAVLALTRFQFQPSAPPISNKDKRQKEVHKKGFYDPYSGIVLASCDCHVVCY